MNPFQQFSGFSAVCASVVLAMTFSCQMEPEPENNNSNNGNGNNGGSTFTGDELSEFLVFKDASKISGSLPNASDGQLKISFEDTIYVVRGFPYGARVVVRHNGLYDISGFYVTVLNGSFYYDVPAVAEEAQDFTDVFYVDLQIPDNLDIDYPFTVPIKIQPHGPDGIPIDEFLKDITSEDPEDEDVCLPTTTYSCTEREGVVTCTSSWNWIWEFTVVEDAIGDIAEAYQPALPQELSPFQHGGCCWNGISIPAKYDPYCVSGNPEYNLITVDDAYYVRYFESLDLFDNGKYERYTYHATHNYSPDSSNYCTNEAGYLYDESFTGEHGTHDFVPGAHHITLVTDTFYDGIDPSAQASGPWAPPRGELFYTCHSLMISVPVSNGTKWTHVYRLGAEVSWEEVENFFPNTWD
jgi:hypothetical protein